MQRFAIPWAILVTSVVGLGAGAAPPRHPGEPAPSGPPRATKGLTAVEGLAVGQFTLKERPTGCTVVLAPAGAVAGVEVRGSAPGTRETDLLDPVDTVQKVHAVVLTGGSAFGLDAASGVMRYLDEHGIGFDAGVARVPIVPAAVLFDLGVGDPKVRPGADCGYRAAASASVGPIAEGSIGAGAGATVGKLAGLGRAMKGGIGTASITLPDGVTVAALVAVNALGDVLDPATGRVVAGVRGTDGRTLADARKLILAGALERPSAAGGSIGEDGRGLSGGGEPPHQGTNTTIGVVATNARLTKTEMSKVAQMAQDGMARSIFPVHTAYDGDTIFALSTGTHAGPADLTTVGSLAAEAVSRAILRAVRRARGLPGLPSVDDLRGVPR